MKEVIVHTRSYREDSIEKQADLCQKFIIIQSPHYKLLFSPSGVPGADVDEIINMFRFRRNKSLKKNFSSGWKQKSRINMLVTVFNKNTDKKGSLTWKEKQLTMFYDEVSVQPMNFTSQADETYF